MLTRQLYLANNQIQEMQSIFLKAKERLKMKEEEIGTLKRKVHVKRFYEFNRRKIIRIKN